MVEIPSWLGHLPRDRKGRPQPWLNLLGTEQAELLSVRYDKHVGMAAVFIDEPPGAEVNFQQMNMQRQRQSMVEGLCSICGRHISWNKRVVVVSSVSVQQIEVLGRQMVGVHEPWLHERCARFAVAVCPALIRRRHEEDLEIVPVRSQRAAVLVTSVGAVDGLPETWQPGGQVAMWVKLALTEFRIDLQPAASRG